MPRPEFPTGMVLPVEAIRRINEERRAYDADPEEYERRERAYRDRIEEEERAERDFYAQQLEEAGE